MSPKHTLRIPWTHVLYVILYVIIIYVILYVILFDFYDLEALNKLGGLFLI